MQLVCVYCWLSARNEKQGGRQSADKAVEDRVMEVGVPVALCVCFSDTAAYSVNQL